MSFCIAQARQDTIILFTKYELHPQNTCKFGFCAGVTFSPVVEGVTNNYSSLQVYFNAKD
ncbi:hypothetical protein DPMN_136632 [Dreissena polymorpha]|uniref:Uncharacterized protein n=1 Tax=Dreissena polymorpha TaxID=45954 RepID=A0A9D4JFQ3_DREPO|nr:hypothetical protein DPMN_136632 [Dreissena polymorpha]